MLARWNYQPVRQLVQKIGAEEKGGNEFYNISEVYEKLQNENADSKKIITEQKRQLRNSWLLSLMKGRTTGLMNKEKEEYFDFNSEMRVVLVGFMYPKKRHWPNGEVFLKKMKMVNISKFLTNILMAR